MGDIEKEVERYDEEIDSMFVKIYRINLILTVFFIYINTAHGSREFPDVSLSRHSSEE